MDFIHIIIPIGVGALIGYCTNFIAIKMLFRPKHEIRIGGWRLPFTPGVIPKNKARLAKAAGDAVGSSLVTGDDIRNILCGDELREHVAESFTDKLFSDDLSVCELAEDISGKDFESLSVRVSAMLAEKIKDGAKSVDFRSIVSEVAGKSLSEKFSGTMIAMFLNESTISMITEPIADVLTSYIDENGAESIYPIVKNKFDEMQDKSVKAVLGEFCVDKAVIKELIEKAYLNIMECYASDITSFINISRIVEEKIKAMSNDDLENLVMSVMKNELQTIINLGALIGAVIGVLNLILL